MARRTRSAAKDDEGRFLASYDVSRFERDPNGDDAKKSSRYPITEFGIQVDPQGL